MFVEEICLKCNKKFTDFLGKKALGFNRRDELPLCFLYGIIILGRLSKQLD